MMGDPERIRTSDKRIWLRKAKNLRILRIRNLYLQLALRGYPQHIFKLQT